MNKYFTLLAMLVGVISPVTLANVSTLSPKKPIKFTNRYYQHPKLPVYLSAMLKRKKVVKVAVQKADKVFNNLLPILKRSII